MLEVQFFPYLLSDIKMPTESLEILPIILTLQSVVKEIQNLFQQSLGFFVPGEGRYGVEVCP